MQLLTFKAFLCDQYSKNIIIYARKKPYILYLHKQKLIIKNHLDVVTRDIDSDLLVDVANEC